MVVSIIDIIVKDIIHLRLKMDLSAEQINTYRRRANSNIRNGMLAVIAAVSFQAGIAKPLCIAIHQEPVKSEVCENNLSQFGLLLVGVGGFLTLAGHFAKFSLNREEAKKKRKDNKRK